MTPTSTNPQQASVLAINGGSSSVKFALYRAGQRFERGPRGKIDRIGFPDARLTFQDPARNRSGALDVAAPDIKAAATCLLDWLDGQVTGASLQAVGHRVVHGMNFVQPERVTAELLAELRRISAYDPQHLPGEIELIEAVGARYPAAPQVACFDTAFHRTMPRVASILPIPRRFDAAGIRRYGFHGLSYAYLSEELARRAGDRAARGRVILAHLGNGASLAALRDGRCVDTSMGFTPAGGLPMSTRTGDLDPGVAWFLMQAERLTPERFNALVNHESGLLGVSETSSDVRDLLEREGSDPRAAEAIAMFCYQAKKWIGAFAAALGGLETLVFAGGIGENAAEIRARICAGLEFLGVELDNERNASGADVISSTSGRVAVRIIRTDEERMIARIVCRVLGLPMGEECHDDANDQCDG